MSFVELIKTYNWEEITSIIQSKKDSDVDRALSNAGHGSLEDFMALISPAAGPYLEDLANISHQLTQKRYGNTIQMYIPMYLSNECQNICTYCGFSMTNKIPRKTLTDKEIIEEVEIIKSQSFDHILLVTGEANKTVGVEYLEHAVRLVRPYFSHISIEVQPLEEEDYKLLIDAGVNTVLVYQETYNPDSYAEHHPKGKKSNFEYRLDTPDRLGKAGIYKIGLGALLGLDDWRSDSAFVALHLDYLKKRYWKTKYSISFPRLRPAQGLVEPKDTMHERDLLQLICAYRIYDEHLELSLSTREREQFRNHVVKLGITTMSAGSKTDPGGYSKSGQALEQFEVSDDRNASEVASMIKNQGYEPVWKDWDKIM